MEHYKLQMKLYERIGMTAYDKNSDRFGMITSFIVNGGAEDGFNVSYMIHFDTTIELVHESDVVIMLGTGI